MVAGPGKAGSGSVWNFPPDWSLQQMPASWVGGLIWERNGPRGLGLQRRLLVVSIGLSSVPFALLFSTSKTKS